VLASRADGESISFVLGGGPPDVPPSETSVLIEALPVATPNG
jgi:hypothetical protein